MKKRTQKAMLTSSTKHTSAWLFFTIWLSERIEKASNFFNIKLTRFSDDIIEKNKVFVIKLNKKREEANYLTPCVAIERLEKFKKKRETFEDIEQLISSSPNVPLKNSFNLLVKTCYKYEARLHKIAFSNKPVIKTPEYIKESFSEIGRESVKSHFEPHNAF